jgi:acetolactate synthase-1/2/3 large subunit
MLDLHGPELGWVGLAAGMGVNATRADDTRGHEAAIKCAFASKGTRLIEAVPRSSAGHRCMPT